MTHRLSGSGDSRSSPSNASDISAEEETSRDNKTVAAPVSAKKSTTPPPRNARPGSGASQVAAGAPQQQQQGLSAWETYRQSRLSTLAKWIYILLVSLFFVALYCGDFSPQHRSKEVLRLLPQKMSSFVGNYTQHMDILGLPRVDLTQIRNGLANKTPAKLPLLQPRTSPSLPRGTVLYAGDYLYNCLLDEKDKKAPCVPTFFQLKDDGMLVLARGTTPSKPSRTIWKSKAGKAKQGKYMAVYGKDGSLEVQLDGKKVWKARKFWQPRVLRPWPLTK